MQAGHDKGRWMNLTNAAARLRLLRTWIWWLVPLNGIATGILIALATFHASYHPNADALTAFAGFVGLGVGILGAWLSVIPIDALRALCEAADTNVGALRSLRQRISDLETSLTRQRTAASKDAENGQGPSD